MRKLFPSQLPDEQVYLVVREHWAHFLLKFLVWLFFAVFLILFERFGEAHLSWLFADRTGQITALFIQVYTMFLAVSLFLIWLFYYLNVQVITDRRIVDIDQVGLFSHTVSELHIAKIEDATSETIGILGTIFGYGNVYIQTAGTVERFEFINVPNPSAIEKLILDLYEKLPQANLP
jgi:hypothetical protein